MKDRAKEEQLIEDARKFPELASMFEEMRGILEEFELHEEEAERRDRAEEEAEKKADEARAEKARAGELGPKWQEIQKRIDQGKTTLSGRNRTRPWEGSMISGPRRLRRRMQRIHSPRCAPLGKLTRSAFAP